MAATDLLQWAGGLTGVAGLVVMQLMFTATSLVGIRNWFFTSRKPPAPKGVARSVL
jgi:hypothetical protein